MSSTEPTRSCAAPVGPVLSLEAHTSTDWPRGLLRASFPSSLHRWSGACLVPGHHQRDKAVLKLLGGGGLVHLLPQCKPSRDHTCGSEPE